MNLKIIRRMAGLLTVIEVLVGLNSIVLALPVASGPQCKPQSVTGKQVRLEGTLQLLEQPVIVGPPLEGTLKLLGQPVIVGQPLNIGLQAGVLRYPDPICAGRFVEQSLTEQPATFTWAVTARPSGSVAALANSNTLSPELFPDSAGTWEVTFTACPSGCDVGFDMVPPLKRVISFPVIAAVTQEYREEITPPYGLQIYGANTVVPTTASANDAILVHTPSIKFNFPIKAAIQQFLNYEAVGWKGHIYTEACLTSDEVAAWPGNIQKNPDITTCPDKADIETQIFTPRSWYQVADATTDLYVIQGSGYIDNPSAVPVNLQQIAVPLRFHLFGNTYYYTNNHTGPNDISVSVACGAPVCTADLYTPPFNLVVLPTAMIQLKMVPETIVYIPPGNKSNGNLKVTKTFTTTVTAGETVQVDNTSAQDDWMELVSQGSDSAGIGKVFNLGFNGSSDTKWDTKTTLKAGQGLERDLQGVNQVAIAFTRKIAADPSSVPGAAGVFEHEPFWSDAVVVLVHPQIAMWDFYGRQKLQLMAAQSSAGLPNDVAIVISDLDACANGTAPYADGYKFTTAAEDVEILGADECRRLAALDPFWGKGQSATLTARGPLLLASQEYGIPETGPQSDNSLDIQSITSASTTVTNQNTATYASTVEDIVATTASAGRSIGGGSGTEIPVVDIGLSEEVTLKQGSSIDKSLTMTLTYKNSSATTSRTDVQTEGVIDDNTRRAETPHVEVFQDDVFGTLMFRDPDAQCSPMPDCRAVAPLGPSNATPLPRVIGTAVGK